MTFPVTVPGNEHSALGVTCFAPYYLPILSENPSLTGSPTESSGLSLFLT